MASHHIVSNIPLKTAFEEKKANFKFHAIAGNA